MSGLAVPRSLGMMEGFGVLDQIKSNYPKTVPAVRRLTTWRMWT
jgi:hypothetical protein